MKMIKVLNLYAGIVGNRKLWVKNQRKGLKGVNLPQN